MRVATFLIYLCFLLLRGYGYPYAGSHFNNVSASQLRNIEKRHKANLTNTSLENPTIGDAGTAEDDCLSEDVEDDDTSNLFSRKYKLLTRWYVTVASTISLSDLHSCWEDQLPFCSNLSYKYLIQRALRI
ncbi:hypothetical protein F0L74_05810 [Chitinophaga agrisoli]|uniref:Uncharacterized protein n=1 Tax=Chitinophaga agrisoli TaxID=2607653 RepID=A0A5B2W458_9BACT|nr:hypothetical protein [Chitinophaga agrisoli]KAA2245472.1 hypothetical protein F0L74_05810 [Chitinophaga agrisoli]